MELSQAEILVVQDGAVKATERQFCELNELQLALVGGGIGETVL